MVLRDDRGPPPTNMPILIMIFFGRIYRVAVDKAMRRKLISEQVLVLNIGILQVRVGIVWCQPFCHFLGGR